MTSADQILVSKLTPEEVVGLTLWGEARGSSPALRMAIACVIQNRVAAQREKEWGLTPQDVCLAPGQFSCWSSAVNGAPNHASLMDAVAHVADGRSPQGPILRECLALAWQVTGGTLEDTTHGGVLYYSPDAMVPRGRVPKWAVNKQPTAIIDNTYFFGLDAAA